MYGLIIVGMDVTDQINFYFGSGNGYWQVKYEGGGIKWQTDNAVYCNLSNDANEYLTIRDVDNGNLNWNVYIIKLGIH